MRAQAGIISMQVVPDILRLRNPAVISSSPISENLMSARAWGIISSLRLINRVTTGLRS